MQQITHTRHFKENEKNTTLHYFVLFLLRSHFKNLCIVFHHDFQTLENNKSTRPKQPHAFICFLMFGNRYETLALVFVMVRPKCDHMRLMQSGHHGRDTT